MPSLLNVLKSERDIFLAENAALPPDKIQRLWQIRKEEFVAVLDGRAPTRPTNLDSTPKERKQQHVSQAASPMAAPSMSNKRSSHSLYGPIPFANTGERIPPLALDTWQTDTNVPFNGLTARSTSPAFKIRKLSQSRHSLHTPEESQGIIVYENPADYFKQPQPVSPPTIPINARPRRSLSKNHTPSSPYTSSSNLSCSPATSTSDAFTVPTPVTSVGMSRDNTRDSLCERTEMLRVESQTSDVPFDFDLDMPDSHTFNTQSTSNSPQSMNWSSFNSSLCHVGGVVDDGSSSSVSNLATLFPSPSAIEHEVGMGRSISSDSNESSKSRLSRRSQEVVQSTRLIKPKEKSGTSMSRQSSSSSAGADMARVHSADGSKVGIPKNRAYVRPAHPKVMCTQCNDKPDGFRGPHELRRHIENKHSQVRKVWVCKDRSPDQKFLSKCKACNEVKVYGAYYNAAAHLRRIHFHAKEKGRKSKGNSKAKPRGGDGGGDDPPMEILKLWIEEKDQVMTNDMPPLEDNEEDNTAFQSPYESSDNPSFQSFTDRPIDSNFTDSAFGEQPSNYQEADLNAVQYSPFSTDIPSTSPFSNTPPQTNAPALTWSNQATTYQQGLDFSATQTHPVDNLEQFGLSATNSVSNANYSCDDLDELQTSQLPDALLSDYLTESADDNLWI